MIKEDFLKWIFEIIFQNESKEIKKNENFLFEFASALLANLLLFENKESELFKDKISVKEVILNQN